MWQAGQLCPASDLESAPFKGIGRTAARRDLDTGLTRPRRPRHSRRSTCAGGLKPRSRRACQVPQSFCATHRRSDQASHRCRQTGYPEGAKLSWSTARLTITPLAVDDAPELFEVLERPLVSRYLGRPELNSVDALRADVTRKLAGPPDSERGEQWLNFVLRCDGAVVGRLQATIHGDWAEVGWVIGDAHWGRGFGTEGGSWLNDHLFDDYGIAELWATVDPANVASVALLARLGFARQDLPSARLPSSYEEGDLVFAFVPPVSGA